MADIIHLLPDAVANQIAAGEVIQRPASVVKELIENAIDAGSTTITLLIKDAGKTLIQVTDNGCGMSETDARMCFERHATSKIKNADDLFSIKTKGFRGEAMASIAAIAQVDVKTKKVEDELGVHLVVEGTEVKNQEPCATGNGTTFQVKNLFFNVPARRKFLKSTPVELKHIIEEFQRVALTHPDVTMSLKHNDTEIFHLPQSILRQRIVNVFGKKLNEALVPIEEDTNIVTITGFIGKPELAKKTRGEQYFFVNDRFIKSPYLNHAVVNAYDELIAKDVYPSYFLYLQLDPDKIDINIHPTKTEIKFEDEKSIYAIVKSAVKQAIGKYNVAPSIDFDQETTFNVPPPKYGQKIAPPEIKVDPTYNPFEQEKLRDTSSPKRPVADKRQIANQKNWELLYNDLPTDKAKTDFPLSNDDNQDEEAGKQGKIEYKERLEFIEVFQVYKKYAIVYGENGLLMVHCQRAKERILYEQYLSSLEKGEGKSQQLLFPETIELSPKDAGIVSTLMDNLNAVGIVIRDFGKNAFVVEGVPANSTLTTAKTLIAEVVEQFQTKEFLNTDFITERLAKVLAKKVAYTTQNSLAKEELKNLINELFLTDIPHLTPNGKAVFYSINSNEISQRFN